MTMMMLTTMESAFRRRERSQSVLLRERVLLGGRRRGRRRVVLRKRASARLLRLVTEHGFLYVSIAMRLRACVRAFTCDAISILSKKKRTRGKEEHTTAREKNDASALEQNRKNASRCAIFKKTNTFPSALCVHLNSNNHMSFFPVLSRCSAYHTGTFTWLVVVNVFPASPPIMSEPFGT